MLETDSNIKDDTKVNSILDYLNDVNTKDTDEFVPKSFKEYSYDINLDINDFHHNQSPKSTEDVKNTVGKITETPQKATETPRKAIETPRSDNRRKNSISKPSASVKPKKIENTSSSNEMVLEKKISHEIELTDQINEQKLEIADKTRTISMLEKALVSSLN